MNCRKVQTLLIDYAETGASKGKSPSPGIRRRNPFIVAPVAGIRQRLIQRHLEGCGECRKELERIEKVRQHLMAMHVPELTEHAWDNFQEKLSSKLAHIEHPSHQRLSRKPAFALAGAGAVFVLFLLLVLTKQWVPRPIEKGPSLAKNLVPSALSEEQIKPKGSAENGDASESDLAGLPVEKIDELADAAALLSDDEWNEFLDGMSDGVIESWDVQEEVDALSLEECDEMLERLEST